MSESRLPEQGSKGENPDRRRRRSADEQRRQELVVVLVGQRLPIRIGARVLAVHANHRDTRGGEVHNAGRSSQADSRSTSAVAPAPISSRLAAAIGGPSVRLARSLVSGNFGG